MCLMFTQRPNSLQEFCDQLLPFGKTSLILLTPRTLFLCPHPSFEDYCSLSNLQRFGGKPYFQTVSPLTASP